MHLPYDTALVASRFRGLLASPLDSKHMVLAIGNIAPPDNLHTYTT